MKTLLMLAAGMTILFSGIVHSQDWTRWKADSTKIQVVKTKDGSRIRARIIDISAERVTVRIYSEMIDLPTDSIQSIKTEDRVVLDQEGRTKLLITSTALSLGFYGWGIPSALRLKDDRTIASSYLFISAGGFFLPYLLTRKSEVSDAAATGYYYGSTRGIAHGLGLYTAAAGNYHWDHRNAIGAMVAGSLAEGIGFYHLSNNLNYTGGRAEAVGVYGDFGLINLGLHVPKILELNERHAEGAALVVGSGIGLIAGHYLTRHTDYTRGDALALADAGFLGGYMGLTSMILTGTDNEKLFMTGSLIGSITGLSAGRYLLADKNFTTGQGSLIRLSMLAGALTGSGVTYLISKEPDEKLVSALSCLGAIGGYAFMFRSAASTQNDDNISQNNQINFYFNPVSLLVRRSDSKHSNPMIAGLNILF